jgi:DHA3 family macrolide efflux protein-like MFS transporter
MTDWKGRFFTIWAGQACSLFGSSLVSFALIWWLTEETGSAATLATASLVTLLPTIVLGPFAGTLVDRWNRRAVLIAADGMVALFTALLAYLYWQDLAQPWHLYVIMFLRSLGGAFHQPAMMASTSLMVPPEQLTRVGGMNQTLAGMLRIVAPPLGALLLGVLPMQGILAIDIVTVALAIVPLLFIPIPQPQPGPAPAPGERASFLREFADGFRYVWGWRALFVVVATCTLANVFVGPAISFMPLLVTRDFGGGAFQLSLVASASGAGLIIGGFFMTLWGGFKRRLVTSAIGWGGVGICYILVALIPGSAFYALLALIFCAGFSVSVGSAPLDAFYQSCVAPDKQGRVFAVLGSIDGATMPLGLIIAGAVGDTAPLRIWWLLVGISHAALAVAWLVMPVILRAEDQASRPTTAPLLAREQARPA